MVPARLARSRVGRERQLVSAMSKFSDQEKAAILRRSRELLSDDEPPVTPPAPAREPPPLTFEDPVAEWRSWHDDRAAEREANRAALRAEEREAHASRSADWDSYIDSRVAVALQRHQREVEELARACAEFSNAVQNKLDAMDKLLDRLDRKFVELRAIEDLRRGEVLDLPANFIRRSH